jgi:ketosteroid isomerase-like protein
MPTLSEIETTLRATLDAFARAWGARDLDAIMRHLTDDCVYGASLGPEPGTTFRGQAEVRAGIAAMLAHDDAAESQTTGSAGGIDEGLRCRGGTGAGVATAGKP